MSRHAPARVRNDCALAVVAVGVVLSGMGCSVNIRGETGSRVPAGNEFEARAVTERRGTEPTGVTLHYTHKRAADGAESPAREASVSSNADAHSATVEAEPNAAFAAFDRVTLNWRVAYNTWGQPHSSSTSEVVDIDPELRLTLSPSTVTAGQSGSGIVSMTQTRSVDTVVALELVKSPSHATVTLDPAVVIIPAGSTASTPFTLATEPVGQSGGGAVIGPGPAFPNRATIRARVSITNMGTFDRTEHWEVRRAP